MSGKLSAEELAQLEAEFKKLDKNGDGRITAKEILEAEGNTQYDVDIMMAMADANGDGKIDLQEYLLMAELNVDDKTEMDKIMFKFYDSDRDGYINVQEFVKMLCVFGLGKVSEEDALEKIAKVNPKVPGKLDYDEYLKVMAPDYD